jgi:hypothetical protein
MRGEGQPTEAIVAQLRALGLPEDNVATLLRETPSPGHGFDTPPAGPPAAGPETPWSLLKRLRAEGHPTEAIAARLTALGLDAEDVRVLMLEAPPAASGFEVPGAAKAAVVLVGGPMLGGLLLASLQESVVPREPPPPQVELDPADTSPRCAQHPRLASVGTCPRCGSFVCRDCAGLQLSTGCLKCQKSPALRAERVKDAARAVAIGGFAIGGLVWLLGFFDLTLSGPSWAGLVGLLLISGPWLVPAIVQLTVHAPWPAIAGCVVSGLTLGAFVYFDGPPAVAAFWMLCIGVQTFLIRRLVNIRAG